MQGGCASDHAKDFRQLSLSVTLDEFFELVQPEFFVVAIPQLDEAVAEDCENVPRQKRRRARFRRQQAEFPAATGKRLGAATPCFRADNAVWTDTPRARIRPRWCAPQVSGKPGLRTWLAPLRSEEHGSVRPEKPPA